MCSSFSANRRPMHMRRPYPNGKLTKGWIFWPAWGHVSDDEQIGLVGLFLKRNAILTIFRFSFNPSFGNKFLWLGEIFFQIGHNQMWKNNVCLWKCNEKIISLLRLLYMLAYPFWDMKTIDNCVWLKISPIANYNRIHSGNKFRLLISINLLIFGAYITLMFLWCKLEGRAFVPRRSCRSAHFYREELSATPWTVSLVCPDFDWAGKSLMWPQPKSGEQNVCNYCVHELCRVIAYCINTD